LIEACASPKFESMKAKALAQTMLNEVNAAIRELVGGAASATVTSGGATKSYTRAELSSLRELRRDLRLEIQSYNSNGRPGFTLTGVRNV
jgi:hypothetical protein